MAVINASGSILIFFLRGKDSRHVQYFPSAFSNIGLASSSIVLFYKTFGFSENLLHSQPLPHNERLIIDQPMFYLSLFWSRMISWLLRTTLFMDT
jgi:hypothetical protein